MPLPTTAGFLAGYERIDALLDSKRPRLPLDQQQAQSRPLPQSKLW